MKIPTDSFLVIGLMSGTSKDGVDAVLLRSDGVEAIEYLAKASVATPPALKDQLNQIQAVMKETSGDIEAAADILSRQGIDMAAVLRSHADLHAAAVKAILQDQNMKPHEVDLIGCHGQTLFHLPAEKITVQALDADHLAEATGIATIYDFRSADVLAGGQGAPLAPLYHKALAMNENLYPVIVANCGGIANVTVIAGEKDDQILGFDTGPGNGLIDQWVKRHGKGECDLDGQYGLQGKVNEDVLAKLFAHHQNYLDKAPPKSLDIQDFGLVDELKTLSFEDAAATLEAFTAHCLVDSLRFITARGIDVPRTMIVAGGGWNNPVILRELKTRFAAQYGDNVKIMTADDAGWRSQTMEAEIFAHFAVRRMKNLPLSVPGTTGAAAAVTGGQIALPQGDIGRTSTLVQHYWREYADLEDWAPRRNETDMQKALFSAAIAGQSDSVAA